MEKQKKSRKAALAEAVVEKVFHGGRLPATIPGCGPVTDSDRKAVARVANASAAEFERLMVEKLEGIADLAAGRIKEHLEGGNFKPSELAFLLSVVVDKRGVITGKDKVASAQVNVQVNNYASGSRTKEEILASLAGKPVPDSPADVL